ncbi:PLAT/LH2 domain-containing protein [Streptomyces sp. 900105245]
MPSYEVKVKTADDPSAGTDADVAIELIGDHAGSGPKILDNAFLNDFENNATDTFTIDTGLVNLGHIKEVVLRHNNMGIGPAWKVDWVTVKGPEDDTPGLFEFYRWIAADENDFRCAAFESRKN